VEHKMQLYLTNRSVNGMAVRTKAQDVTHSY
jgi:hypothetical protein